DVEITLTPFSHDGRPLCLIAVNDVTSQDEVRLQVLEAERFREVGEVAARVAHNFGNLLQVIMGSTEMLLSRQDLPADVVSRLQAIRTAGEDGTDLVGRVRTLMAHGRPGAGFAALDLASVVQQTAEWGRDFAARHAAAEGGAATEVVVEARGSAFVKGSASELRELLLNLVKNGIEAAAPGGRVELVLEPGAGRHVVLVRDTGAGMPPSVLAKLFRPFFTTKGRKGTGFGLATAFAIAQAHGGRLAVDSIEGIGSTFHLTLPAAPPPA
ncbi:MAG: ATP-binding protein, partial [Vicinamibacterales bacterium]